METSHFTRDELWALRTKAEGNVREDGSLVINQAFQRLSHAADSLRAYFPKSGGPPEENSLVGLRAKSPYNAEQEDVPAELGDFPARPACRP